MCNRIEATEYGMYIELCGNVCRHDLKEYIPQVREITSNLKKNFSVILNLSYVEYPICHDTAIEMAFYKAFLCGKGLNRLAIVYSTNATIMEVMKLFKKLGYDENERHICSLMHNNWREIAEKWVIEGIEP